MFSELAKMLCLKSRTGIWSERVTGKSAFCYFLILRVLTFLIACAFHLVLLTKHSFITKNSSLNYHRLWRGKTDKKIDILVLNMFHFFKWKKDHQRGMLSSFRSPTQKSNNFCKPKTHSEDKEDLLPDKLPSWRQAQIHFLMYCDVV